VRGWPNQRNSDSGRLVAVAVLAVISVWLTGVDVVAWGTRLATSLDPLVTALDAPPRRSQPLHVLIIGSDSRRDIGGMAGGYGSAFGTRADAIVLARIDSVGVDLLNIPRDLRVATGVGDLALAAVLEVEGAPAMVSAARQVTGLPVHHYVEFEFGHVAAVIDAAGGLEVATAHPLRDTSSGLDLPAGTMRLSGEVAVAYLRSRRPEALIGEEWVALPAGDLARIERQQHAALQLLRSLQRQPREEALAALLRAWEVGAARSTLRWTEWPRLKALLASDVDLCTLPVRELRSQDERTSPFAPTHVGALFWLVPTAGVLDLEDMNRPSGPGGEIERPCARLYPDR
jgi:LCP family protein required for cell wall assembly